MFRPPSAFIALRYATAGKHNSFVSFINRFSVAGIALGLCALVIVLSVMNGFEAQLKARVLGMVPHVLVKAAPDALPFSDIAGVRGVMAYRETEGVVQSRRGLRGVQLQGVDPQGMQRNALVAELIQRGRFSNLAAGQFVVIIGRALATQLEVNVGDRLRVLVAGASVYTPFGRLPSQRLVTVGGIFDMRSQLDDKVVYLHQDDLRRLLRQPAATPPDTRLFLDDAFAYQQVVSALAGQGVDAESWRARQGPLFDAVKMEKNMMFLMLLLIIAVAAFNIVSALVMVVTEKQGDIAILQSQGMTRASVRRIFMLNGLFNGAKGALIGVVLGVVITLQLNNVLALFNVPLALSADGKGVPVVMEPGQVVMVTLFALGLCLLASVYPAIRASRVMPATALQND
ncbi:lipoprotein-releasing ABC transporter permease subunit [Alteromonas sp. CYL-A6]|uniref:lipoprotein-releasing ABC transporter permease subunit n=1 Tax=Alteromonas nitratireducens TaxID=3390813 RepID=UPI0034C29EF7